MRLAFQKKIHIRFFFMVLSFFAGFKLKRIREVIAVVVQVAGLPSPRVDSGLCSAVGLHLHK